MNIHTFPNARHKAFADKFNHGEGDGCDRDEVCSASRRIMVCPAFNGLGKAHKLDSFSWIGDALSKKGRP